MTDGVRIAASWRNVSATRLATVLRAGEASVATVEHLMSALAALGVEGATVTLDGPEIPIMDGSAAPFFDALAPHTVPAGARQALKVLRPVVARRSDAFAALLPYEGRGFDVGIDFADEAIGAQRVRHELSAEAFRREIAPARTFGRLKDVAMMRKKGYGRGASLDNAIAVDGPRVVNEGGLRMPDEFARHKLLDAVGDLSLAQFPLIGLYRSHKAGHRLNFELLRALFADDENFAIVG